MKVTKKCKKCNLELQIDIKTNDCPQCGEKLTRLFSKNINLGAVVEDDFVVLNREMKDAPTPSGADKVCF